MSQLIILGHVCKFALKCIELTPMYWPQVGRRTSDRGNVRISFYGRSVCRSEGSRTADGPKKFWLLFRTALESISPVDFIHLLLILLVHGNVNTREGVQHLAQLPISFFSFLQKYFIVFPHITWHIQNYNESWTYYCKYNLQGIVCILL